MLLFSPLIYHDKISEKKKQKLQFIHMLLLFYVVYMPNELLHTGNTRWQMSPTQKGDADPPPPQVLFCYPWNSGECK